MNPARWQQVKQVLESVLDREPGNRAAFLARACGDDASLRSDVESLVSAYEQDPSFIELPAVGEIQGLSRAWSPPQAAFSSGENVGPYQITSLVASGGMGAVYEAVRADDAYRKKVAIKIIRQDVFADPRLRDELLRRFRAERQTLANLEHPNIARLLDGGSMPDGTPYLVMEFIEGRPIDAYCDENRLPIADRLRLFRTVCSAVLYAHQQLVVHRDLKPGNILVDPTGSPKLLDFGIAKLLDPDSSALAGFKTRTAGVPLTPAYASPEQIRGQPVTTATDIYSLGVILYELLTGHRPYRLNGHGVHDLPRLICEEEPTKPSVAVTQPWSTEDAKLLTPDEISRTREGRPKRLRRRLAGDLDTIVLTALRKEPDRRYASVEQFSDDIRRHLEREPIVARKATTAYRVAKFIRRHKLGVLAASFAAMSLVGGAALAIWQAREATWQAREARKDAHVAEQIAGFWTQFYRPDDFERPDLPAVGWSRRSKKKQMTLDSLLAGGIERIPRLSERPLMEVELRENMAKLCSDLHRFDESLSLHQEILAIRRRQLGNNHPKTLVSMANVGFALMMSGKWQEARPLLAEALESGTRVWGPSDRNTLDTMMNLGLAESKSGQKEKAEVLFRKVVADNREQFGEQKERTLRAMNLLGQLLGERKRFAEAQALLERTVEISKESDERGPDHPATLEAINNLAWLLYQQDRLAEAVDLCREVFEGCQRVLTEDDPQTLLVGHNLARCLVKIGRPQEAEPIFSVVISHADVVLPADDFNAALYHRNYGECLTKLGRCKQAEQHLSSAFKKINRRLGPAHEETRKSVQRLVEFYEKCGPAEKAQEYRGMLAAASNAEAKK